MSKKMNLLKNVRETYPLRLKTGKTAYFRSLAVTLAISFSALIMVALLIASSLQMYFSFQAQQKTLLTNHKLIAENTANTVEYFIREKFSILETTSKRKNLISLPKEEQETVLGRLMGLEPAFRQLALYNEHEMEMIRASRIATLSPQPINYSQQELFHKVSQK